MEPIIFQQRRPVRHRPRCFTILTQPFSRPSHLDRTTQLIQATLHHQARTNCTKQACIKIQLLWQVQHCCLQLRATKIIPLNKSKPPMGLLTTTLRPQMTQGRIDHRSLPLIFQVPQTPNIQDLGSRMETVILMFWCAIWHQASLQIHLRFLQ